MGNLSRVIQKGQWDRRNFLKTASTATLGALAAANPRQILAKAGKGKIEPTADCMIVLWMGGGMAHTETFDPKRYTPYEKGLSPDQVLSTFPAIDSAVDHIKLTKGLEKIGSVMDRGTLIRTYKAGDLGFILHSRHQYQWHTGYAPPQTVAAPHIGAVIARTLGPRDPAMPAFIDIGQRLDVGEGEELKAFHSAGFLGSEYGPFHIANADEALNTARPPAGMGRSRLTRVLLIRWYLLAAPCFAPEADAKASASRPHRGHTRRLDRGPVGNLRAKPHIASFRGCSLGWGVAASLHP